MTAQPDTEEDTSYGRLAYELFMGELPHDWDNAPDRRRWIRVGEGVARAQREASAEPGIILATMKVDLTQPLMGVVSNSN